MTSTPTPPTGLARRAVLALGAAVLLPGCASTPTSASTPTPARGSGAGPSPLPSPSPSPSPSAGSLSDSETPGTGVCPTDPDVFEELETPQQHLTCEGMNIALTIDDGPHPVWTPEILAVLARYDVRATFCVIGSNAAAHPDLVAAVIDGGHDIANHTFNHPFDLAALTQAQMREEIERTTDVIVAANGGVGPRLFRAPGGIWSTSIISACTSMGMRPLGWSVDTRDWSLPGVQDIVDTMLTETDPGAIILSHDGGGDRQQTAEALDIALPRLIDAGYDFALP